MASFDEFMAERQLSAADAPRALAEYIREIDPTWAGDYEEEPADEAAAR